MRPAAASGLVLLAAAVSALGGCLGSAIGVLTAPMTVAEGTAEGVGTHVLNAGGGPISDLDRILANHPDSANTGELQALRDSLLQQGLEGPATSSASRPTDEFDRHARRPGRWRADEIRLEQRAATGARSGPAQREEAKPFANARTSSIPPEVRRWYDIPITPIRITPLEDGPRASREASSGAR